MEHSCDGAHTKPFFEVRHFGEAPRWYIGDRLNAESYIPIVFCPYCGMRLPEAQ